MTRNTIILPSPSPASPCPESVPTSPESLLELYNIQYKLQYSNDETVLETLPSVVFKYSSYSIIMTIKVIPDSNTM